MKGAPFEKAYWMEAQSEYITDGVDLDTILPNFIIKFESYAGDFACLASILGTDSGIQHLNPTSIDSGEPLHLKYGRTCRCRPPSTPVVVARAALPGLATGLGNYSIRGCSVT